MPRLEANSYGETYQRQSCWEGQAQGKAWKSSCEPGAVLSTVVATGSSGGHV